MKNFTYIQSRSLLVINGVQKTRGFLWKIFKKEIFHNQNDKKYVFIAKSLFTLDENE